MKVNVTKENVVITESSRINEGEYRVNKCYFQLPECFEGLTVTAAFDNIPVPLFGKECYIPALKKGTSTLGVYAYKETDEGLRLMYSPKPTRFYVDDGSYNADIGKEETPEISQFEKYCEEISKLAIPKANIIQNFDIDNEVSGDHIYSASAIMELTDVVGQEVMINRGNVESLQEEYKEFSRVIDDRVAAAEDAIYGLGNGLVGNKSNYGSLELTDVSPVKHSVNIGLSSNNVLDFSNTEVTIRGKNLFGFSGRSVRDFGDLSNTSRRNFTGDGIYVGVSGNNYYNAKKVTYIENPEKNEITVDCMSGWYGVGVDVPVNQGEVYIISMTSDKDNAKVLCSFYTANGDYISFVSGNNYKFTVPDNARWMLCILSSSQVDNSVKFKNVQIEKGSEATEFCKYVHPKRLESNSQGIVLGGESIYPVTIIETANEDINISVQYNRDINVAFNELRDAIVKLGGAV